ncbi:MAG: hypothetical protein NTV72_01005 [Candidatus Taylorbacteria bacterium]|nr:hypothetical protein [Candidatus Taylorbacteria bacterium]
MEDTKVKKAETPETGTPNSVQAPNRHMTAEELCYKGSDMPLAVDRKPNVPKFSSSVRGHSPF